MSEYTWDTRCADLELARLEAGFTPHDFQNFARVLLTGFTRTVKDVHIVTGSLLSSSRVDLLDATPQRWSGEISYGGVSAGVKNPVRYAASEFFGRSRSRGGPASHNYFRSTDHIDGEYIDSVGEFISRGRHTPHPEGPLP